MDNMTIRTKRWMKYVIIGTIICLTGILYSCKQQTKTEWSNLDMVEETSISMLQQEESEVINTNETQESTDKLQEEYIYVHVCGEVNSPNVYRLKAGSRVYEAIELAGGMTSEGVQEGLNMASVLQDGQQIIVYSKEDIDSGNVNSIQSNVSGGEEQFSKVNINTATMEQLMTLPGIGEAKAKAIIDYRTEHGQFKDITEIMNISGIKEAAFGKIKDFIQI